MFGFRVWKKNMCYLHFCIYALFLFTLSRSNLRFQWWSSLRQCLDGALPSEWRCETSNEATATRHFGWRLRKSVVSSDVWMKHSNYMMMEYSLFNPWKLSIGNLFLVIFFAKQIQIQHFPTLEALSMSSERPIYSIDLVSLAQHFGCTSMEQLIVLISRSISEVWVWHNKNCPGFINHPWEAFGNHPKGSETSRGHISSNHRYHDISIYIYISWC